MFEKLKKPSPEEWKELQKLAKAIGLVIQDPWCKLESKAAGSVLRDAHDVFLLKATVIGQLSATLTNTVKDHLGTEAAVEALELMLRIMFAEIKDKEIEGRFIVPQ